MFDALSVKREAMARKKSIIPHFWFKVNNQREMRRTGQNIRDGGRDEVLGSI
jgi:hypothetical protein